MFDSVCSRHLDSLTKDDPHLLESRTYTSKFGSALRIRYHARSCRLRIGPDTQT